MNSKVAIVAHDAGGGEILSSFVKLNPQNDYFFCIDGPSTQIFTKKIQNFKNTSLHSALQSADWMLTGTSWKSEFENIAIQEAKSQQKKVVSFLDHWVNFKYRFVRETIYPMPDEIWVGDKYALDIATKEIPNISISLKKNYYWEDLKSQIRNLKQKKKVLNQVLFIGEPVSKHAKAQFNNASFWGYTEKNRIELLFEKLKTFHKGETILFRPHPTETIEEYAWILEKYSKAFNIKISKTEDLLDQVLESKIVFGFESMALVIALIAQKRVVSCIPKSLNLFRLPFENIETLDTFKSEY